MLNKNGLLIFFSEHPLMEILRTPMTKEFEFVYDRVGISGMYKGAETAQLGERLTNE